MPNLTEVALSSGCFIGHEERLGSERLEAIELASHRAKTLGRVLGFAERSGVRVLSVHAPCPSHGAGLNLASYGEAWAATELAILETMQVARRCKARFVVLHAFYCLNRELPADDIERMAELRRIFSMGDSIVGYVDSEPYARAKALAVENLKSLLPRLRREFPRQSVVLENLNPRLGYGGIRFTDVTDMVEAFGGDVGICLDVGHLTLASAVLGEMDEAVEAAGDLIWTTHIHRNFSGRFCIDRNWNEDQPRPGLQEVDTHLPFLPRYRHLEDLPRPVVGVDNRAFEGLLEGVVQYQAEGQGFGVEGASGAERLLRRVPPGVPRVFELDSRYAPLDGIVAEYRLACRGEHPVALW